MVDLSGVVQWEIPTTDPTDGYQGCTTFDFDLDGAREVVFADAESFYILSGRTGRVLYQDDTWESGTVGDVPLIADIDGDGSVEIVMTNGSSALGSGLWTWEHLNDAWPPGTNMWPSATWSGTSLNSDGTVPRTPRPSWLTTKAWRGQPTEPWEVFGTDLVPEVAGHCVSACRGDGRVRVAVRLGNRGPAEATEGGKLSVYTIADDAEPVLLEVLEFPGFLDDGWTTESQEILITTGRAEAGILLVAGDAGDGQLVPEDCAPENNSLVWRLEDCE